MKKIILLALTVSITGFAIGQKKEEAYKINSSVSKIEWTGKKVTGKHNGEISISNSDLLVKNGAIQGGTITVDMTSITCSDMQGEMGEKLVGHLKSDDFFAVDKFNTAVYVIKSIKPIKGATEGKPNNTISGDLTIKGITHELSFPAIISVKDDNIVTVGEVTIDRTIYDVRYGSATFFENIGNKAISNDFTLNFKLAASKK
ncbi:MAG: YceI family protein [Bacteroidetes bacterium]|nr:YceI family protein [Bacteroidota bacterium]HET6245848.1 YceI family protein [Bacteroidia bacterium]